MNSKGIEAINDIGICMKCLKKKATHIYNIYGRGYGSEFDEFNTHFNLCDDCSNDKYDEWVKEKCSGYEDVEFVGEDYKYENDIQNLINSFPIESQELFWNRFSTGSGADHKMEPQDWIDYSLNELPHVICKQYGLYSKDERDAYSERFPNCNKVKITKYKDGSSGSACLNMAFGDKDGKCGLNCQSECYMCSDYKPRTSEIKIIDEVADYYNHEKDRLIHMIQYGTTRLEELENNVESYMEKYRA